MPSRSNRPGRGRSPNERPFKLDMSFPDAIKLLATAPKPGSATQTDSGAGESGRTTTAASPGPAPTSPEIERHQSLLDGLLESQTREGTYPDSPG